MSFQTAIRGCILLLPLAGCAIAPTTPQLQLNKNNISMAVKAKVPIVIHIDYSKDGKYVASAGMDGAIRLWNIAEAKQERLLQNKGNSRATSVIFSPDGRKVAASNFNTTSIWDISTGGVQKELDNLSMHWLDSFSYSPDGRYLLGHAPGSGLINVPDFASLRLVDTQTGGVFKEFADGNVNYAAGQISPDGRYLAVCRSRTNGNYLSLSTADSLSLIEIGSGRTIWDSKHDNCRKPYFSPDGQKILVVSSKEISGTLTMSLALLNAANGELIKEFTRGSYSVGIFNDGKESAGLRIRSVAFSADGKTFASGNGLGQYKLWDVASGKVLRPFKIVDEATEAIADVSPSIAFSPDGQTVAVNSLAATRIFNVSTGEEVATMVGFEDGEWLITTPSGYYNSSAKGDQYLDVKVDGKPFVISQLRESFYRPDLVKLALAGDALSDFRKISDIKQPPLINIVDTPTTVAADQVTVSLQITDQGGGIGDVRLYRNGTAVVLDKTRNLQVTSNTTGGRILQYTVSLEPGKNAIRAIAFNGDNTMQSGDASIEVDAKVAPRQPALYAVVVGIQTFLNPRLDLSYSVADANLFADTLEQHGKGLYSSMKVRRLTTPAETTKEALLAVLAQAQREVRPEDLFVFYVASHGTVNDGQYMLITSNVGSTFIDKLKQDALTQNELKGMISNIPASKKLVVLDTCDAGKMGDALQVALLTRGMNNDTAMNILSRAVGSTILSAATSDQEAIEGYKGHGLFTYVVTQGLAGEADMDRDGFVKTLELANYVDSNVPELAMKVFKHRQYPIISPSGQGFPLAKVGQ